MVFVMKSQQNSFNPVIKFINDFKKIHPTEIEDVFSNGYCYWFAKILSERFYNSKIYYLPIANHFITKIDNEYYDITGVYILNEKPYEWNKYQEFDYLDYKRVVKYCILKED